MFYSYEIYVHEAAAQRHFAAIEWSIVTTIATHCFEHTMTPGVFPQTHKEQSLALI